MSETTTAAEQPPYLAMVAALRQQDVLDVAELAAMRVANAVSQAQGGPLEGEPTDPPLSDVAVAARAQLARRVVAREVPQRTLAMALMQAPDVAAAVAADPSNPAAAMVTVDLAAAFARNWTDYALLTYTAPAA